MKKFWYQRVGHKILVQKLPSIYPSYYLYSQAPQISARKTNLTGPFIFIVCSISLIFVTLTETPSLYETVTLPFIKNEKFSVDWVYNILEHKKETERIGNKRGFTFSFVHTQHHCNFFHSSLRRCWHRNWLRLATRL